MTPQEAQELRKEVAELRMLVNFFVRSDRYRFPRTIDLPDGVHIRIGGTTGSMIGNASTSKIGFWGATPIVRPASDTNSTGQYAGTGTAVKNDDTFDGDGTNSTKYSISGIVKSLKNVGILTP